MRQGDPLSPKIFNCVLESVLREVLPQWLRHDFSIHVGGEYLTNLRFADDVILVARTRGQLTNMMQDFFRAFAAVGVSVHPDKTKVLKMLAEAEEKIILILKLVAFQ